MANNRRVGLPANNVGLQSRVLEA